MTVYLVFCDPCGAVLPHDAGPNLIACTVCRTRREVDVRQLAAVLVGVATAFLLWLAVAALFAA